MTVHFIKEKIQIVLYVFNVFIHQVITFRINKVCIVAPESHYGAGAIEIEEKSQMDDKTKMKIFHIQCEDTNDTKTKTQHK